MFSVRVEPEPGEYDQAVTALWEAGTAGIVEGAGYLEAFFEDAEAARQFGDPRPATAELGAALMDRLATEAVTLVRAFLDSLPGQKP